ncbi:hypothetical protein EJ05DRAFT_479974 [Pseudovirgaria hyperparasitica]|uniref:Uncharacterized protein n=1 Tax=Pseudovirgaria hyperparasitica TaxID=470096 RepID=A0A6A6VUW8_9PEZI|nr:uncharacterized protein EJ05DRAFT_479974 [Pseudovirgaria hyperparasitica]KAF2753955.1 hypothetical protein EJ05DRAFT_479974 [Pseudovirgaria hyperparasitica]
MSESRDMYDSDIASQYDERTTFPDLNSPLSDFTPTRHQSPYGEHLSYSGYPFEPSETDPDAYSVASDSAVSESIGGASLESTWGPLARHWYNRNAGLVRRSESPTMSRSMSPSRRSLHPTQILLPLSRDQTPRSSPDRDDIPNVGELSVVEEEHEGAEDGNDDGDDDDDKKEEEIPAVQHTSAGYSFIRFTMRGEIHSSIEHIENSLLWLKSRYDAVTEAKLSKASTILVILLGYIAFKLLLATAEQPASPDLVMVAQLSKSYEPLLYYTEDGFRQVDTLQETSIAVWDLGETIRQSNMTSGPIIFRELDDLSGTLMELSQNLNVFLGQVTSDVDSILSTMDWAKRELAKALTRPTTIFDSVHGIFSRIKLLERGGQSTKIGEVVTELFGQTTHQRTMVSLHRTFNEFLNTMERSINDELTHCNNIIRLFNDVDGQFMNLQRTVIREKDQQEREEGDILGSMWHRLLGSNSAIAKFEKNRKLLSSIKDRTVRDKHMLVSHHGRLLTLKANLEGLRRRLFSPLVRGNASSSLSAAEQIEGLNEIYEYVDKIRDNHKVRMRDERRLSGHKESQKVIEGSS